MKGMKKEGEITVVVTDIEGYSGAGLGMGGCVLRALGNALHAFGGGVLSMHE